MLLVAGARLRGVRARRAPRSTAWTELRRPSAARALRRIVRGRQQAHPVPIGWTREAGRVLPRVFNVQADARQLGLTDGEFQSETGQLTLHLAMAMHGGDGFAFGFALLLIDLGERLFRRKQVGSGGFERGLLFSHLMLELHYLRV